MNETGEFSPKDADELEQPSELEEKEHVRELKEEIDRVIGEIPLDEITYKDARSGYTVLPLTKIEQKINSRGITDGLNLVFRAETRNYGVLEVDKSLYPDILDYRDGPSNICVEYYRIVKKLEEVKNRQLGPDRLVTLVKNLENMRAILHNRAADEIVDYLKGRCSTGAARKLFEGLYYIFLSRLETEIVFSLGNETQSKIKKNFQHLQEFVKNRTGYEVVQFSEGVGTHHSDLCSFEVRGKEIEVFKSEVEKALIEFINTLVV